MDFKELRYVLTIDEEKSFTRAAQKLFMAQPSLSQYIKRLEDSLGFPLFDRSRIPLALTDEGEQYVAYARQILLLKEEMRRGLEDISRGTGRGNVSLGIPSVRGSYLLPLMIPHCKKKYPHIEVTLIELPAGNSDELERRLSEGKLDLCILSHPTTVEEVAYETIFEERLLLAVPPYYESRLPSGTVAGGKFPLIDLSELKDQPFILTTRETRLRRAVERLLSEAGFTPKVIMETNSLETAQKMVSVDYGFTFAPEMFMRAPFERHCPTYRSILGSDYLWPLLVAHRKGGYLSRATRTLLGEIKLYCRELLRGELMQMLGYA